MTIQIYNSRNNIIHRFETTYALASWLKRSISATEQLIARGGGNVVKNGEIYSVRVSRCYTDVKRQECIKRRRVKDCKECLHYKECGK